jgi:hypothetical protein
MHGGPQARYTGLHVSSTSKGLQPHRMEGRHAR